MIRVVVLLKYGEFEAVECVPEDVFRVAATRAAGICAVFESRAEADHFIKERREDQVRLAKVSSTT